MAALDRLRRELTRTYRDVMQRCEAEERLPTEAEMALLMGSDVRLKLYAESLRDKAPNAA